MNESLPVSFAFNYAILSGQKHENKINLSLLETRMDNHVFVLDYNSIVWRFSDIFDTVAYQRYRFAT